MSIEEDRDYFFFPNKKINAHRMTGTTIVRANIPKKFGFPVIPKIQVVKNKAIKIIIVVIAKILRNNCIWFSCFNNVYKYTFDNSRKRL